MIVTPEAPVFCRVESQLRAVSDGRGFNFLHLKAEADWLTYCARWEGADDGGELDSCPVNAPPFQTSHDVLVSKPQAQLVTIA